MKKIILAALTAMLAFAITGCSQAPKEPEKIVGNWEGDAILLLNTYSAAVDAKEDGTIHLKTKQKSHTGSSIGMNFDGTWKRVETFPGGSKDTTGTIFNYQIDFNGTTYYATVGNSKETGDLIMALLAYNDKNEADLSKIMVTAHPAKEGAELTASEVEAQLAEQSVKVISTEYIIQDDRLKNLYPDFMAATVENKSGKTIKNLSIGYIAWDENSLPVKISAKGVANSYYYVEIDAENANILDGETWAEKGVEISGTTKSDISQFKAIVVSYTDYDGNKWENPLLKDWQTVYENKPLS